MTGDVPFAVIRLPNFWRQPMHRLRSVIQRQQLISAPPTATVYEVTVIMSEGRVGAIPILLDERIEGIFSERDLMTRVVVPQRDPKSTVVSEVMTHEVVTASPEEHVDFCLEKMRKANCRHLPVEISGRIIAMISMRDLLLDEVEEQDQEIRSLREYLHQAPV
jgi:CBS domain-containing protein